MRAPLHDPALLDSPEFFGVAASRNRVLDQHEFAGGRLSVRFSGSASRDFYDAAAILSRNDIDRSSLSFAFVTCGAMSRRDWRTVAVEEWR